LDLIENVLLTDNAEETLRQSLRGVATEARIREILGFIEQRANYVLNEINQEVTIEADAATVSGLPRVRSTSVTLSGQAPETSTVSITVNGQLAETMGADRDWIFTVGGNQLVESETLLAARSSWKFLDDGSDQGTAWRETGYDDAAWQAGPAQLGYGDGDETTVISNGPGQGNAATSYFRSRFTVSDLSTADVLSMQLLYNRPKDTDRAEAIRRNWRIVSLYLMHLVCGVKVCVFVDRHSRCIPPRAMSRGTYSLAVGQSRTGSGPLTR
jgi:hypothetical protein